MSEKEKTMNIRIKEYQMCIPMLTKKMFEEEQELYQLAMAIIRLEELDKHFAYIKKCNNPTNSGTNITFCVVNGVEEYQREYERLLVDVRKLGLKFEKGGELNECI